MRMGVGIVVLAGAVLGVAAPAMAEPQSVVCFVNVSGPGETPETRGFYVAPPQPTENKQQLEADWVKKVEAAGFGKFGPRCTSASAEDAAQTYYRFSHPAAADLPAKLVGFDFKPMKAKADTPPPAPKPAAKASSGGGLIVEDTGGRAAAKKYDGQLADAKKRDLAKAADTAAKARAQRAKDEAAAAKAAAERKARGNRQ